MLKVLVASDLPTPSGFGRISTYLARFLHSRGHDVRGAGFYYNGDPHGYPFHIWPLVGQDIWGRLTQIINTGVGDGWTPDLVISIQDFPYHVSLGRDCPIDWSHKRWIFITPIDGMPIYKEWEVVSKLADGKMVISLFGVEAMRQQGVQVDHCPPGVDTGEFYPATPQEKAELRAKAGIQPGAFLVGMFCMNQGRKAIPHQMEGFMEFARDKAEAVLYLDMDEISPAGWNIPLLAEAIGLPTTKILLRKHIAPMLPNLRDRYVILDCHGVLAFREGFGLPLLESMACQMPTFALDWCSGTEIVGDGRGYLVPVLKDRDGKEVMQYGTWGNAKDAIPDVGFYVNVLNTIYRHPIEAAAVAKRGHDWAILRTWEDMGRRVEDVIVSIYGPVALRRGATLVSDNPNVQPQLAVNSPDAEVPGQPDGDQRPGEVGDSRIGRGKPGVGPAGVVQPAGEGGREPQSTDTTGVRSQL